MKFLKKLLVTKTMKEEQEQEREEERENHLKAITWFNEETCLQTHRVKTPIVLEWIINDKLPVAQEMYRHLERCETRYELKRYLDKAKQYKDNVNPPVWDIYKSMKEDTECWEYIESGRVKDKTTNIIYTVNGNLFTYLFITIEETEEELKGDEIFNGYEKSVLVKGINLVEKYHKAKCKDELRSKFNRFYGVE